MLHDPEVLILDEPTSGLDPIGTRQIKDVIRRLGDMGKTILLSSHLLADVEDVCDRVVILYGGQVRAEGTIAELLAQKDITQITTEKLDPDTIEEIRRIVARRESKEIEVGEPRGRLENLFLQIVHDAQAARVATSGVGAAGAIPQFLGTSTSTGEQIIEALLKASEAEAPAQPREILPETPSPPPPVQEVIAQLLKPTPPPEPDVESVSTKAPEAPAETGPGPVVEADRSVIDKLLGGQGKPPK
jgi:ABC-2 type transport system ATP-binding protein